MFFPCLGLLLVSLSGVLGSNIAPVVIKPTAVAERDIFSSISVVGPTVSLAAPQPTGAPVVYTLSLSLLSTTSASSKIASTSSVVLKRSSSPTTTPVTESITSNPSPSSSTLTTAQWTWTSVQKNPASYNLAITTTYTQSPQCTEGAITMMDAYGPYLWANSVNPLSSSTVTTCYPSQFYSSIIGNLNKVKLPAFSALICPNDWETYPYNATYIGCCPKHFNLQAPNYKANPARPFSDAICTSQVGVGGVYFVSSYKSTAYWTEQKVTATTGTLVYADAFDGFTAPAAASTPTAASTLAAASIPAAASALAAASTHGTTSVAATTFVAKKLLKCMFAFLLLTI